MKRAALLLSIFVTLFLYSCDSSMEGSTRDVIVNLTSYGWSGNSNHVQVQAHLKVRQKRHNEEWMPTQVVATIYSSIVSDDSTARLSMFLNLDSLCVSFPTPSFVQFDERTLYLNPYRNYDLEAYFRDYYYNQLSSCKITYPLWRVEYNDLLQSDDINISINTNPIISHEAERNKNNM